jgi:hypothetical protein
MNFASIIFNFLWCRSETIDIYQVDLNTKLAAARYNSREPNLFSVRVNVTLVYLKDQLDQINRRLNHSDTRRVDVHQSTQPGDCVVILEFYFISKVN